MDTQITVLVVDDQEPLRRFMLKVLAGRGYRVIEAGHGAEAIEIVDRCVVDLLIADVVMPGMTGLELVTCLRSQGCTARVLLISGQDRAVLGAPSARADLPFLRKPFSSAELVSRVRETLAS